MSGHSKWSTIKRQKAVNDQAKGKLFSKLVKAISIAVKTGGGSDPDMNPKLRVAIDAAKASNMPSANIDRAISRASTENENLEELVYEGYGPGGVGIIIEVTTDSRNRAAAEIKHIFDRNEGSLGSPGSVAHQFMQKGYILIGKSLDAEEQMLELIDLGVDDIEETEDGIEIFVNPTELYANVDKLKEAGYVIKTSELIQKPTHTMEIADESVSKKVINLLTALDDHDDVQKVYTNADLS